MSVLCYCSNGNLPLEPTLMLIQHSTQDCSRCEEMLVDASRQLTTCTYCSLSESYYYIVYYGCLEYQYVYSTYYMSFLQIMSFVKQIIMNL